MDFHRIKKILQTEHTLDHNEWKGAVLFLCDEDHVYLIQRSERMPTHSGQLAFVGGHRHEMELNPWETAQREFEEETSLNRNVLEFFGYLPVVVTANLQPIVPVVARLHLPCEDFLKQAVSNGEWDRLLSYQWSKLSEEERWDFALRTGYTQTPVKFHTIKAKTYSSVQGNDRPLLLWGATAAMIWDLLHLYYS